MNNLTQTQLEAKQGFLNRPQDEMLALYEKAAKSERTAIIKQIDNFLPAINQEQKSFWLKFKKRLKSLDKAKVLFPLDKVEITVGAQEALIESNQLPFEFLGRHQAGDWGIAIKQDAEENDLAVKNGLRIFSTYKTGKGERIWIITEADRSSTTILLPDEY